jgi:hypothetical protein
MKSILFITITICLATNTFGQKRLGFDVNTRLNNFSYSTHFQQVIKGRWLYSVGVFGGLMGFNGGTVISFNSLDVINGMRVKSPFQASNLAHNDTSGSYNLYSYSYGGKAIGLNVGIGYFFEFGNIHGIRINSNARIGSAKSNFHGVYVADVDKKIHRRFEFFHPIMSISLELYHTYRLNGRYTFYYGFKVPYFFNIQKSKFNSINQRDLYSGIEVDFSLGVTYAFGKCN